MSDFATGEHVKVKNEPTIVELTAVHHDADPEPYVEGYAVSGPQRKIRGAKRFLWFRRIERKV